MVVTLFENNFHSEAPLKTFSHKKDGGLFNRNAEVKTDDCLLCYIYKNFRSGETIDNKKKICA